MDAQPRLTRLTAAMIPLVHCFGRPIFHIKCVFRKKQASYTGKWSTHSEHRSPVTREAGLLKTS